jgi:2-polyprenyl-3-methyl-5-hydroxy-6-metoxy-1,4-benzoquinol methylase
MKVLDVGGRKSHYTIGVPAQVTISDLPRQSYTQKQLHLGINAEIVSQIQARRSNIEGILFSDMTRSCFAPGSFDCVVAIEVLEHVDADRRFIEEIHRVLKPGGAFLLTTPNGDFVPNTNPDHKRHYTSSQLRALLASVFANVQAQYAIKNGPFYRLALRSWSAKHPLRTLFSMAGALANSIESAAEEIRNQPVGTQQLIAVARK